MAVGLMLVLVSGVFAQTYYYQYVETVDANGVRSKGDIGNFYITITRNSCYVSDEKGIKTKQNIFTLFHAGLGDGNYAYKGEQNNLYVFSYEYSDGVLRMQGMKMVEGKGGDNYIYFSKDYKRINVKRNSYEYGWTDTVVFQQATPPSSAPSTFY